jgi:SAM-dependent methyltransferase
MDERLELAAAHWAVKRPSDKTRWWMHPAIIRHINRLVCGEPIDGPHFGFNRLLHGAMPEGGFRRAISIGCGSGGKEIRLLRENIVQHFDLFEISEPKIQLIRQKAAEHGVLDRVSWHHADAFEREIVGEFDLVYWNNSLHHMFDVQQAIAWSARALQSGGCFAMDDYVGPTRFQWTDLELEMAARVRALLPDRFLVNPRNPNAWLDRAPGRPDVQVMMAADPTEAADSGRILSAVKMAFPQARLIPTGGIIYHLALNDVLANFGEDEEDQAMLESLLLLDEILARSGHTQYAVAIARKD